MKKLTLKKTQQIFKIWLKRNTNNHCRWLRFNHEFDYETDCSHYYETAESQDINPPHFVYCPFCGKPIIEEVLMDCGSF